MLIYITIFFSLFTIYFLIFHPKTASAYYLLGSTIGWIIFMGSLLLYIAQFNYTYLFMKDFFNIPYGLWHYILYIDLSINTLVRLINFSVLLFVGCFYLYVTSSTFVYEKKALVFLPCIFLVIELIIYDPTIYKLLYFSGISNESISLNYKTFSDIYTTINTITTLFNCSLLVGSLLFLAYTFYIRRHIPIIRTYYFIILLNSFAFIIVYVITLSWAPTSLVSFSNQATYLIYNPPTYSPFTTANTISISICCISLVIMIFATYKYRSTNFLLTSSHKSKKSPLKKDNLGLTSFAHSFKNQLIAIQFESETILETLAIEKYPELIEAAKIIHSLALNAKNNLNLMHKQLHNQHLILEPLCVSTFILEFYKNYIPLIPPNITFSCNTDEKDTCCFFDEEHLEECLNVLIRNAIEAIDTKVNGIISIEVISLKQTVIILIKDNGCGISSEDIPNIFDTFYSTKKGESNWGIGLTYVKRIIQKHAGQIIVTSIPSKGTTFKITLPKIT